MGTSGKSSTKTNNTTPKRRVFSGIQPTGDVQLGNYLGAIKGWVDRQAQKENFFCIVDLHAITVPQDPLKLQHRTRSLAAILFAAGLDPDKCTVFIQSHVSSHTQGSWILNCVTPVGWLERMTQYKDKLQRQERISTGLLSYPVLMAADILLYDAHEVPVGDDQKQHVELARDIGQRFNHLFGETFVIPEAIIPQVGSRIMGLDDPLIKMSKSYAHIRGHAIHLLDDPTEIQRSIKRAVTDSGNQILFSDDPTKAGVNNLLGIYKVITNKTTNEIEIEFSNAKGYGDLKTRVAEVIIEELKPIKEKYTALMDDVAELDRMLSRGAEQASQVADLKLTDIKQRLGLVLPGQSHKPDISWER